MAQEAFLGGHPSYIVATGYFVSFTGEPPALLSMVSIRSATTVYHS